LVAGAPATLATALIGTGFSYSSSRRAEQALMLARVLPAVRDIRRAGAAAVDLCWVGAGRLDGFYEHGLQPWDWAAGGLVAAEAGARAEVLDGDLHVAAPPHLFDELVSLVNG
jgi:myo-inositol-1(or 4)-monophosphatase